MKTSNPSNPRIGIDARLLTQTGVGVYIRNLLSYSEQYLSPRAEVVCFVRDEDVALFQKLYPHLAYKIANERWHTVSEQTTFLRRIQQANLDLMHFTYFSFPIAYLRPYISTIHDLTPLLFKTGAASTQRASIYEIKHKVLYQVLRQAVSRARYVITPSQSVKNEIISVFSPRLTDKIIPIYEGQNMLLLGTKPQLRLEKTIRAPYFLYVGNFYPHKNIENLIESWAPICLQINLVLVGPDDMFARRIKSKLRAASGELNDRVHFIHDATDGDLVYLYTHARALVHPSLAEGFGLTLAEAQAFKTPIIASDIPVFQELFAGSFVPFNPKDVEDMKRVLSTFLKGQVQAEKKAATTYSFETMAQQTFDLYFKALESPHGK
jgi:glycosyltransferase involved in cell wall biosynthesis